MNDSGSVRRSERVGQSNPGFQQHRQGERAFAQPLFERFALEELHDDERLALLCFANVVDGTDVRVVQRGDRPCFTLKPLARDLGAGQLSRQQLDRDLAFESRVARPIDFAHAAGADAGDDLVRAEPSASGHRHSEWAKASSVRWRFYTVATILVRGSSTWPRPICGLPRVGSSLNPPERRRKGGHYVLRTSGLSRSICANARASANATFCSARSAIRRLAAAVLLPTCGVRMTFGSERRSLPSAGT